MRCSAVELQKLYSVGGVELVGYRGRRNEARKNEDKHSGLLVETDMYVPSQVERWRIRIQKT